MVYVIAFPGKKSPYFQLYGYVCLHIRVIKRNFKRELHLSVMFELIKTQLLISYRVISFATKENKGYYILKQPTISPALIEIIVSYTCMHLVLLVWNS